MIVDWQKRFQEIEPYYEKGLNDREIEKATGIPYKSVWKIRKKNNKPPNGELFGANVNHEALRKHCKETGIPFDSVDFYWDKSERFSIKVKKGVLDTQDFFSNLLDEMKGYEPKFKKVTYDRPKDGHLLVIDPADVHIGKLAMALETGEEYNVQIAIDRCLEGVRGILEKSKGFDIERILLVIGNDILHIDTTNRTTTKGTPQDTDGQWWSAFNAGKDLYIKIVEVLSMIAPLDIVYNPSNHDYMLGHGLAQVLDAWFREHSGVTFDVTPKYRKYYKYGKNMIATSHGDCMKEKDAPLLMAQEEPFMWGETTHRYIYLHHVHHKKKMSYQSGKDYIGVTMEHLRSPSPSDGWHHRSGYIAPKAVEGFIHHPTNGQVARLTNFFN